MSIKAIVNARDLKVRANVDGSVRYSARFVGVTREEQHAILDLTGPDAPLQIETCGDELIVSGLVNPAGITDRMETVIRLVLPEQVYDTLAR